VPESVQDAIEAAGSPIRLLWRDRGETWMPFRVPREHRGWRAEQAARHETVALSDLSFHMTDTEFTGPDALRLLSDFGVNDLGDFAVGQAKQYAPVTSEGLIVTDGILLRTAPESFLLTGVATSQSWLCFTRGRGATTWSGRPAPTSRPAPTTPSCSATRCRVLLPSRSSRRSSADRSRRPASSTPPM